MLKFVSRVVETNKAGIQESTEKSADVLDFLEDWEKKELENFEHKRSSE